MKEDLREQKRTSCCRKSGVSDKGTSFVSNKFKIFLKMNGIKQITTPVKHLATNGQTENAVKLMKKALKRSLRSVPSCVDTQRYVSFYSIIGTRYIQVLEILQLP